MALSLAGEGSDIHSPSVAAVLGFILTGKRKTLEARQLMLLLSTAAVGTCHTAGASTETSPLAPVGESWGDGIFFFHILLLPQLPRLYHTQIKLLHLAICEITAWQHCESRAVTGLSGRSMKVGVASRSVSGPTIG